MGSSGLPAANPLDIIEDLILRFRRAKACEIGYYGDNALLGKSVPSCPLRALTSDFALDAMSRRRRGRKGQGR